MATAETAEQALKELKNNREDLLVLDIELPDNTAVRLFRTIKRSRQLCNVPVLFALGSRWLEPLDFESREMVEQGDGYLQKPF